ncbi:MAG: ABC transporter ATP-binding protein [Nanoarchaeota archaeon]
MANSIIAASHLSKDYYQYKVFRRGKLLTHALRDVSFSVKEGDFFGLLGQNGAGKTTLLKILTTNLMKSGGEVMIDGVNLEENIRAIKPKISWMFGVDYEGYSWSTIEKNLMLAAYYLGLTKFQAEKRVYELLRYFDLYKKRKLDVWRMSAGMQAKYALAAAMLKQPKILFLDEPLLGLDVPAKETLRQYLVELHKQGTTIVYTDHQLHEVEKVCKNLIIVEAGKKVYDGSLEDLKEQYRDTHVLELTCQSQMLNRALLQLQKKTSYVREYDITNSSGGTHEVKIFTTIDSARALPAIGNYLAKQNVVIESLNAGLLSLEDVFKKFINRHPHHRSLQALRGFHQTQEKPLVQHANYLKHKNADVRGAACTLLMENKRTAVEKALKKMSTLNKQMQISCLQTIGETHARECLKTIQQKLNMQDKDVQFALTLAEAKIGYRKTVVKLIRYLLIEETCATVLNNIAQLTEDIQERLGEQTRHLSREEKQYLRYHVEKHPEKEALMTVLRLMQPREQLRQKRAIRKM